MENNTFDINPVASYATIASFTFLGAGNAGATSPNRAIEALRTTPIIAYQRRQGQAALNASEVLNILQDRFGLSVSQLAEVTHVSRPTIYGWLKNTTTPRDDDKAHRLDELMTIARICNNGGIDCKTIGRLLRRSTSFGPSMLALLSESKLDHKRIQQGYDELKTKAIKSQENMFHMAKKRKTLSTKYSPEATGDNLGQLF